MSGVISPDLFFSLSLRIAEIGILRVAFALLFVRFVQQELDIVNAFCLPEEAAKGVRVKMLRPNNLSNCDATS